MTSVKNSDVYWLGKVASDWEIVPAWRVMTERREKSLPDDVHLTPSQTHGVLPQKEYMDRTGNKVVLNLAGADNMKRVCAGDFIIHLRSFEGGIEASTIDGKVSNAYTVLTPAPDAHFDYYRWFMKSVPLIEGLASSTDQLRDGQSINFSRFSRLSLPLPPLETQQRIADYLDRETADIDAAVADLDKYVELLEKRRQVLVSEAVDSLSSASLIKTVRNLETLGWLELGRGKIISKEDMENSPGDYPVYSSAFTDNGFFGKYGEYLFEDERISWSIDGGGMPFYRHKHRYSLTNVSGWMRVADNSVLDVKYLYYAVLNAWYRNSFDYAFKAHPSVIRDLYSISIPDLSSQQQMADYLDRETAEIDNLIAESKKLRDLLLKRRSVLITEVATGRKQV